ncbi:MAG: thermonuclease family protein [Desulfovibrionaceae bacterium]|nr:thermonuclease family protein [Desulfovibrionaceae bacterium]
MKIKSVWGVWLLGLVMLPLFSLGVEETFLEESKAQEEALKAKIGVSFCFDGDTVKLNDRRIVRISGIDTPELAHDKQPEQFYAKISKAHLEELLNGHKVSLENTSVNGKDRYGRIIADILLDDGQSIAELMVSHGAAFFYPHKDLLPDFQERLLTLQRNAIRERQGMWGPLLELPVAHQNFIGNKDSLRFFPADCPQAQKIKPRQRVYFGTLMDAFVAGFAPARICLFWPPAK